MNYRLFAWRFVVLALALSVTASTAGESDLFSLPALQDRFMAIKRDMIVAMQAHNPIDMEDACRAGRALIPADPTFAYNLACALALQGKRDEAIEALRNAIALGFRDINHIGSDTDLASLKTHPAFDTLLKHAGAPRARDAPRLLNDIQPAVFVPGGTAVVTSTNTVWDFDNAFFKTFFTRAESADTALDADAYNGPAYDLLRDWLKTGQAAGNVGDLYDNRDNGHSRLKTEDFPGLTSIVYGPEPRQSALKPYYGAALFIYNLPTIGNSSTALTQGPFWRSQARMLIVNPLRVTGLFAQYISNHIYFYPAHQDFTHDRGDVFPFNAPYYVVSSGSSGSDQPFMRAFAATWAAFQPETKKILVQSHLLAPTVQMILRTTQRTITTREAYFTGRAHPPVFTGTNLNEEAMVRLANNMDTNTIPPLVTMRVLREAQQVHGRDFFDGFSSAALYDSPACIARVFRGVAYTHTMTVAANAVAVPSATNLTWRWAILQGDPQKITIKPDAASKGQVAEITVAYHEPGFPSASDAALRSSRVDIGVFAHNGTHPSTPAIISVYFLANERRVYSDDHRILAVDYGQDDTTYVDPTLSYRRRWKDVYHYDNHNRMTGWTRSRGVLQEEFTAHGLMVETRDAQGRTKTAHAVRYLPRSSAGANTLPDLIQVPELRVFTYTYTSAEDVIGRPVADN